MPAKKARSGDEGKKAIEAEGPEPTSRRQTRTIAAVLEAARAGSGEPMPRIVEATGFAKGGRGKPPAKDEVTDAAKLVRAHKELLRLAELRLVHQAKRAGMSQDTVAALLGTSQPTISRIAKQIAQDPSMLELRPSEVINQRTVGQIDTGTVLSALMTYTYRPGSYNPAGGDGYLRGDWLQIENALATGLITDEEYDHVAREASTPRSARAAR